jgi:hypothetical protein
MTLELVKHYRILLLDFQALSNEKEKNLPNFKSNSACNHHRAGSSLSVGGGTSPSMPCQNIQAMLQALDEFNSKRRKS